MIKFFKVIGTTLIAAGLLVVGGLTPASAIGPSQLSVQTTTNQFLEGAATGNFTITGTQSSSVASMQMITINVRNSVPTGWVYKVGCPSSAGNHNGALCGVTGINVAADGVNYSDASSGAEISGTTNAQFGMYQIKILLANPVASAVGTKYKIDLSDAFTAGVAGTYALGLSVMPYPSGTPESGTVTVTSAANVTPQTPASPTASLTLGASTGSLVAGSNVTVAATGLQTTAGYTVVVESTPQTIGSGNAVSGAVSTSVTLPSGLEAGWHTLTFTSTAADGTTVTSVAYFKVSASGTLLATSSTLPAELANTGFDGAPYLVGGIALAVIGGGLLFFARRKQSN